MSVSQSLTLLPSLSLSPPISPVEMVCIDPPSNWGEGQRFTNKAQGQETDTQTHDRTHTQ